MSEVAAIGAGLAIGLLIVLVVLAVKRDEVARSAELYRSGQSDPSAGPSPSTAPSRGAMAFGSFAGSVSIIAGGLLGEWLPLVAGVVLLAAVVMQVVAARRLRRN